MLPLIGSLIGAGANLFGGLMGQSNQAAINQQNIAAQEQINQQNIQNQDALNAQNIAEQEKFAQSGIQWRVNDAKAAGISPLAALGAQTASFSNNVGSTAVAPKAEASNSFGTGVAAAGQDISRAIAATRSPEDQAIAMEKTRQDLESGQLDNDLKRTQIASATTRLRSAQVGPGIASARPQVGAVSQWPRDDQGNPTQYPSRDIEGAAWIDPFAKYQYAIGHQVLPALGYNIPKSLGQPSKDRSWYRNPLTGDYYQAPSLTDAYHIMRRVYDPNYSPDH